MLLDFCSKFRVEINWGLRIRPPGAVVDPLWKSAKWAWRNNLTCSGP